MGEGSGTPRGNFGSTDGALPAGGAFPGFGPAPPTIAPTSAAGAAGTASRSDHTHAGVYGLAPPPLAGVSDAGVAFSASRADHTHGGQRHYTVANAAALAALASASIDEGSICYVATLKDWFFLIASTQAASALVRVAASGKAGFLWERLQVGQAWWSQLTWFIDPVAGSDENTGASSGAALKTCLELRRRFGGRNLPGTETASYVVNLLGDVPDTDFVQVSIASPLRGGSISVTIQGVQTVVATATIASAVARSAGANHSNDIVVTGFNFAPHVGRILRLQGTTTTTAVIEAALTTTTANDTARLSEENVNTTVGAGLVAGQVVEILTLTKIPGLYCNGGGVQNLFLNDVSVNPTGFGLVLQCDNAITTLVAQRCQFIGPSGGTIKFASESFVGCAFVTRAFTIWGKSSGTACGLVNATVSFIGTGVGDRAHWSSCGGTGGGIIVAENAYLRLASDFHMFGCAAGAVGVTVNPGGTVAAAGAYYGSGNDATAIGVQMTFKGAWFYPSGLAPTADFTIGLQVTNNFGTTNHSFASLPYALDAQLNTMAAV